MQTKMKTYVLDIIEGAKAPTTVDWRDLVVAPGNFNKAKIAKALSKNKDFKIKQKGADRNNLTRDEIESNLVEINLANFLDEINLMKLHKVSKFLFNADTGIYISAKDVLSAELMQEVV